MARIRRSGIVVAASILSGAAGLASSVSAEVPLGPSNFITWQGRAFPAGVSPSGLAWAWNANSSPSSSGVQVDSNGRVYFVSGYTSTPQVGTIAAANNRGLFTASSSTDLSIFMNAADYPTGTNISGTSVQPGNTARSLAGTGNSALRVSGTSIAFTAQVFGSGITETATAPAQPNNSMVFTGTNSSIATSIQRGDSITLNDNTGTPTAGRINTDFRAFTQASEINSSGLGLYNLTVAGGTGTTFTTTTNATTGAQAGNNGFLALKSGTGAFQVIAQGGMIDNALPNNQTTWGTSATGLQLQNGSGTGVGGFGLYLNRNSQVAYGARYRTVGFVSTANDDAGFIYDKTSNTTVRYYREGDNAPDSTGAPDAGSAQWGSALSTNNSPGTGQRSFSTAGLLFQAGLRGGDVIAPATTSSPSPANRNDSALYLATTSNTVRIIRRGDQAPGLAPGVQFAVANNSNLLINNNGFIFTKISLQGAVTPTLGNTNFPPAADNSQFGDDAAVMVGTPGNLRIIARQGDIAPFSGGLRWLIDGGVGSSQLNNNNELLFTATLVNGTVGQIGGGFGRMDAQFYWSQSLGLLPLIYQGQTVEVDTGVFKTVQSWAFTQNGNADGSSASFSDNGVIAFQVRFTDATWGIVKTAVPAPGAGILALGGIAALGRRRRSK